MDILIGKAGCVIAVICILLCNHACEIGQWLRSFQKRSLVVNYQGSKYIIEQGGFTEVMLDKRFVGAVMAVIMVLI